MAGCAPSWVTEIAAAILAKRMASGIGSDSDKSTARAPLKVSPAEVVSTTLAALNAGK